METVYLLPNYLLMSGTYTVHEGNKTQKFCCDSDILLVGMDLASSKGPAHPQPALRKQCLAWLQAETRCTPLPDPLEVLFKKCRM